MIAPADLAEAQAAVAEAASCGEALEIRGGGTKRALGRPPVGSPLDMSRIAGIVDYDPCELVLTARAGTSLADIETVLAANRQMLAFEPPDWRPLLGTGGEATLGGIVACNLSGPRRVRAGACRDHVLGFAAINGLGEAWRAGGKVVKNVTGYDLCKLQAGAFGTLSLLTDISVRVLPTPESAGTLLVAAADATAASGVMSAALNAPFEVSAACWLPDAVAPRAGLDERGLVGLRVEGPEKSVVWRLDALAEKLGEVTRLDQVATREFWLRVRDVAHLLPPAGRCIWRVCPTPGAAPAFWDSVRAAFASAEVFFDWGAGLVWLSLDLREAGHDAGEARVRAAVNVAGGHATIIAAPDTLRGSVAVFQPPPPAILALQNRLKAAFDPQNVLNPARM